MKRYMTLAAVCGCLLVGSLYPKLVLKHHVKLVDENGKEITEEIEYQEEIPLKVEFRFMEFFL